MAKFFEFIGMDINVDEMNDLMDVNGDESFDSVDVVNISQDDLSKQISTMLHNEPITSTGSNIDVIYNQQQASVRQEIANTKDVMKSCKIVWQPCRPTTRSANCKKSLNAPQDHFASTKRFEQLGYQSNFINSDVKNEETIKIELTNENSISAKSLQEVEEIPVTSLHNGDSTIMTHYKEAELIAGYNDILKIDQNTKFPHCQVAVMTSEGQILNTNLRGNSDVRVSESVDLQTSPNFMRSISQVSNFKGETVEGSVQSTEPLAHRSASDIQTIISALEEELKKSGNEESKNSIKVEYMNEDMVSALSTYPSSTVQLVDGEQVVEVQHVDNIIWTADGGMQVMDSGQVNINEMAVADDPIDTKYDVVECEVEVEKKSRRGRKKKAKGPNEAVKEDTLDRTCPICSRVLNYASSMAAHMRTHTGTRPYSCGQCERRFTTKANRDRHEATHMGLKPFQCTSCSKCFTEKRSLSVHMRTHTGERPFVCTVCSKAFTQKCTLQVHMDRHTNKKGHLCDLCGKAFRQKCQLDVHVLRHKRQANFPCTQCTVKCYSKGDLVRHMIKHTGERPYQCSECPRAFTRKQYLIDHENMHFGRTPYQCSVCSAAFHDMGSCHRHLRKHKKEASNASVDQSASAIISQTDFQTILEGTEVGQVFKLEDGSDAMVKAVERESDGSTVYHITCFSSTSAPSSTPSIETSSQIQQYSLPTPLSQNPQTTLDQTSENIVQIEGLELQNYIPGMTVQTLGIHSEGNFSNGHQNTGAS